MINLLDDLMRGADALRNETFAGGRQCRYCNHAYVLSGERKCRLAGSIPEKCPEVERQLRVVLFHLDSVAHLDEPNKNDWLKVD